MATQIVGERLGPPIRITSTDGVERNVAVTAFPLFAHAEEFVGIVAIFWRE